MNKSKRIKLQHWYSSSQGVRLYVNAAGAGNGLSADNPIAFGDLVQATILPGTTVYLLGTFNETLTITCSGEFGRPITFESFIADPCIIDSQDTRTSGIIAIGRSYLTFTGISSIDATTNCLYLEDSTNIITNDCVFTGSGNQGIQHIGATTATHNNPTCSGNVDDGISIHDSGNIILNGGAFSNNDHQINVIADAQLTINGSPTFSGTSTYDIYATNATTEGSCVITMNGGTVRTVNSDIGAYVILMGVTVSGTVSVSLSSGTGTVFGVDSFFNGTVNISTAGTVDCTNCYIETIGTYLGNLIVRKSKVQDDLNLGATASIYGRHTIFNGVGTAAALVDVNSGALAQIRYCVFKNMAANQFGVAIRTGANPASYVDNCVFAGTANVGRGSFSQINFTLNNNIYFDLAIGHFRSAGDQILNNCCFNDCTTPKSGTNITSNNEVTGDPLFVNAGFDDYNIQAGSSCLGTGKTLTEDEAIDTATWGDSSTVPVVTTADQGVNWNIGAYI
jgi:hypothetical protein